ncbi:hypothetical protein JN12_03013 [Geobacter argillaceus]|uniref:Transcriptional coactivator p15 (PC4) C-terminal domain-containing protein n=1 Tax=Geobacter argillaceus TaxID=345631 RepID=A0A562VIF4_9BACT|nr:hypothetical protein JN12_03013 [Geobacter argillaceus]
MAVIKKFFIKQVGTLRIHSDVVADLSYDQNLFQIRTYKAGDDSRSENTKQNLQLTREGANELIKHLQDFLEIK